MGGSRSRRSSSGSEGATEVVALGFVDLVGSTAWAESLDLREQSLALTRFESAAWSSAVLAGGRVVKTIGDEVFFAAPSADAACTIGLEVCEAAGADHALPPARGAVGFGPVIPREGDYFGPLVNLLARSSRPRRRASSSRPRLAVVMLDARRVDGRAPRAGRTQGHRGSHTRVSRGASRPRSLTIFCVDGAVFTPTRDAPEHGAGPVLTGMGHRSGQHGPVLLTPIATSKSTVLGVRLDHDRRAWLEAAAARHGVTVRTLCRRDDRPGTCRGRAERPPSCQG